MKHDWTKLDNGWVRTEAEDDMDERPSLWKRVSGGRVCVYDDGDVVWDASHGGPAEKTLEILTEAVAQRRQCEVNALSPLERAKLWLEDTIDLQRWKIMQTFGPGVLALVPISGTTYMQVNVSQSGVGLYCNMADIPSEVIDDLRATLRECQKAHRILTGAQTEDEE